MELSADQQKFLEYCKEAKRIALSFNNPLIIHHHDADGIASGAIVAYAMQKANKRCNIRCIKTLDDKVIESLRKEKEIIFVDLGSGNEKINELADILIIDHHQPANITKPQANCMAYGLDGGKEVSASSTAYFVFQEKVDLGVVGAAGDLQAPFQGLNAYMARQGEKVGQVKIEKDICFYGRFSRPLISFLLYADEIYIPTISYREDRIVEFLKELKIPLKEGEKWRSYADLHGKEKQSLISALADLLISNGRIRDASQLIRESYVFPLHERNETYEASEFSTLLNACGRNDRADIGLRLCLGEKNAYKEAIALLQLHRKNIREGIAYAQVHIQDFDSFYFLDGRKTINETIIGIICGMWLRSIATKPIFGLALTEGGLKISGRANARLIRKGVNIGLLLRKAAEAVGGIGGGHKVAGGATFPKEKLNEFLLVLGDQLSKFRPVSN